MITSTNYKGWNALALITDRAELVFPLDVGPRVISCSLDEGPNLFATVGGELGKSGEKDWKIRGGHRLWHAPEVPPRNYQPDNGPISATKLANGKGLRLEQPVEEKTGIRKSFAVEALSDTDFRVTHVLKNENMWAVELAPWALTVMARNSYTVIPLNPKVPHGQALVPDYSIIPWTYTDFTDPVWDFHRDYIGIRVDRGTAPQKLGLSSFPGWTANWQKSGTFVKYWEVKRGAAYPDFGSSFETYVCDFMNELESLGPLTQVEPGASVTLVEYWGLIADLPKPDKDGVFADKFRPVIDAWLHKVAAESRRTKSSSKLF
ncbi:MAG TPA: hypothetical protein VHC95_13480 [Opitutales bacterium]|nr:hypothetical protein [Opitutales bacterium]